jgi:hypothetical protein
LGIYPFFVLKNVRIIANSHYGYALVKGRVAASGEPRPCHDPEVRQAYFD